MRHDDRSVDVEVEDLETVFLESRLREADDRLAEARHKNQRLATTLCEAREQIASLQEEVERLSAPPSSYGVYLSDNGDGTVNVLSQGRKMRVNLRPSLRVEDFRPGQELVLNDGLNVVETAGYEIQGEVVVFAEQSIVRRAKKLALKRYIQLSEKGLKVEDLLNAVREEFKENEDLPNTTNPDDWAKIAGRKGERIVHVKVLTHEPTPTRREIEPVVPIGQYL